MMNNIFIIDVIKMMSKEKAIECIEKNIEKKNTESEICKYICREMNTIIMKSKTKRMLWHPNILSSSHYMHEEVRNLVENELKKAGFKYNFYLGTYDSYAVCFTPYDDILDLTEEDYFDELYKS